jgi:hypothetical protein
MSAMTRDEALNLAVHIYGTCASCDRCQQERSFTDYKAARPNAEESDLAFGCWLLENGWHFEWHERQNGGWDFRFLCLRCATGLTLP